jgi:flagellar hook-associated protein 1
MSSLSIGASALTVDQQLMTLIGQNISNASTPGYHEQVADLAAQVTPGTPIGTGVQITQINRLIDNVLEQSLNSNSSNSANVSAQLNAMQQVQTMLTPGTGSLNDLLQSFFNQAAQLSSQPDDPTQRQAFLSAASALTNGLNSLATGIGSLQSGNNQQIQQAVTTANTLLPQIATLNGQIQLATLQGTQPNDLEDQRDQLISQLAGIVNIQTIDEGNGETGVNAGGIPVVSGTQASTLSVTPGTTPNSIAIQASDSSTPLTITDGQLAGFLTLGNQTLPGLSQQANSLTQQLISGVNEIHATSIPLTGSFTNLASQQPVSSTSVPLAQAGLTLTPTAGTLYVSVIDNATGASTLTPVTIDPATQSLQKVATALSAMPNLQAVVNAQTNTLSILAQPGYSFNFAGQLPTSPQTTSITGTAVPQLSGTYTGTTNDQYTFTVVGSGTVGVSANLSLQVTDHAGSVLGTFNIGNGYTAGTPLSTVNGVNVQLSGGTVNNGDSFSTSVVANPDSGNLLAALGLNSFFQGTNAGNVAVEPNLLANPDNLAISHTGQAADGSALQQLATFQNAPVLAGGTQTLQQYLANMIGAAGTQVQALTTQQGALATAAQSLQSQQQSVSGVDSNQEMVQLLQYQQSYEMAAQFVSTVSQTFTELFQIMGE